MAEIVERLSIGFDSKGIEALNKIKSSSHLGTTGDVTRAGLSVLYDLVTAEERGYVVILRGDDGSEWKYSPHRPSHALPLKPSKNETSNVLPFGQLATGAMAKKSKPLAIKGKVPG
jgi:hypothetical protein